MSCNVINLMTVRSIRKSSKMLNLLIRQSTHYMFVIGCINIGTMCILICNTFSEQWYPVILSGEVETEQMHVLEWFDYDEWMRWATDIFLTTNLWRFHCWIKLCNQRGWILDVGMWGAPELDAVRSALSPRPRRPLIIVSW